MRREYLATEHISRLEWAVFAALLILSAAAAALLGYLLVEVARRWL